MRPARAGGVRERFHEFERIDQRHAVPAHCGRRRPGAVRGCAPRARRTWLPGSQRQASDRLRGHRRRGPGLCDRLQGRGDRRPLRPRPRVLRAGVQTLSQSQNLRRLPANVRQGGEELRCSDRRHAGSLAFSPGAGGPGDEQAHLLRQADHAHHRRGEEGQSGGACLQGHYQGEPSCDCACPTPRSLRRCMPTGGESLEQRPTLCSAVWVSGGPTGLEVREGGVRDNALLGKISTGQRPLGPTPPKARR